MSGGAAIGVEVAERLDVDVRSVTSVAGGDVNDAFRVETADGPLFVKTRAGAAAGEFRQEAAGLAWLGEREDGPPVPEVVLVHDDEGTADAPVRGPRFLALRWIEPGPHPGTPHQWPIWPWWAMAPRRFRIRRAARMLVRF